MEKKKGLSILKVFIAVICILFIVVSLAINVAFSGGKTPHIFGRYIYIVEDGADWVTPGSALIAKEITNDTLLERDIVICYPSSSPDKLCVRRINEVVTAEDGSETFSTSTSTVIDPENIEKDKIVAIASGYPEIKELGKFINFTKGIPGILLELILPCVILVIFLIAKIASSKSDDFDDENFDFYEYDENEKNKDQKRTHVKNGTPLFEANQELPPSDELERKKMSIAENFSQKKVNPDSPYQKEKERTMQFKAQRSAESSFAARNVSGSSSTAPTADALREEMLRKTAEAERTGSFSTKATSAPTTPVESASDITGILPKAQLAEMSRNDVPKTTPLRSQSAQPAAAPKKSSSPDISDIIKKSDTEKKKKSTANMSVDDLIKLIEDEKKKL